jgi:hypothetical protein
MDWEQCSGGDVGYISQEYLCWAGTPVCYVETVAVITAHVHLPSDQGLRFDHAVLSQTETATDVESKGFGSLTVTKREARRAVAVKYYSLIRESV